MYLQTPLKRARRFKPGTVVLREVMKPTQTFKQLHAISTVHDVLFCRTHTQCNVRSESTSEGRYTTPTAHCPALVGFFTHPNFRISLWCTSTDLLLRKLPFQRLVREIASEFLMDVRFQVLVQHCSHSPPNLHSPFQHATVHSPVCSTRSHRGLPSWPL